MTLDPRLPVLVGVGQVSQPPLPAAEPVRLLAEAARRAAADAGAPGLVDRLESVRVVNLLSRRYPDPGRMVAGELGASPRQSVYTRPGGNMPQVLLNRTAADIAAGRLDVALVGGAESWRTRQWYKARGQSAPWSRQDERCRPDEVVGDELVLAGQEELAVGLAAPVQFYPMFETALALRSVRAGGTTLAAHVAAAAELWAGFSRVAASNPHAALRRPLDGADISTPGPGNRMVAFPYTKLMCSNSSVDQAAAVWVCSVEAARAAGVPPERWVFLHSGADASDVAEVVRRDSLVSSPAIRAVGAATLSAAGAGIDDVELVDLYSCFPSAVQVAAAELGIRPGRALTVTGGLTFAGGPWNNYVTHSVATMVARLRERPGALGLVTANGGHLTKHAAGLYSTDPPAGGLRLAHPQGQVDAVPARIPAPGWQGPATLEAWTVTHDRDGAPEVAFAYGLTADGRRAVGASREAAVVAALASPGGGEPAPAVWLGDGSFTLR